MRVIPRDRTAEDPSHFPGSCSWLIRLVMAPQLTEHETLQNLQGWGDDETVGALVWLGASSNVGLSQEQFAVPNIGTICCPLVAGFKMEGKLLLPLLINPSFHCLLVSFFYWFDVVSFSLVQLWICLVRMSQPHEDWGFVSSAPPTTTKC